MDPTIDKPQTFYQTFYQTIGKYILMVIGIIIAWELLQYWLTPREPDIVYINKPTNHTVTEIDKNPIDCKVSEWGEWSECDKDCGGGERKRTRTIISEAENGGIPCKGLLENVESCNLEDCPIEEFSNKIL